MPASCGLLLVVVDRVVVGAGHVDGDPAVGDPHLEGLAGGGLRDAGDDVAVGILHTA